MNLLQFIGHEASLISSNLTAQNQRESRRNTKLHVKTLSC